MAELNPRVYNLVWLAPLEIEAQAALHLLDNQHQGKISHDNYIFHPGDVCGHNIIIATLPPGREYGTSSAAILARHAKSFFPNLWFGLLVGVASGLPNMPLDIRLGDVLVSMPKGESRGLIAYDLGKKTGQDWVRLFPPLARTETIVASAIGSIKLDRKDTFLAYYGHIKDKEHPHGTFIDPGQEHDALYQIDSGGAKCLVGRERRPDSKRTRVWYGPIGSGEDLTKNAQKRNELRDEHNIIGLEMGAAEVMDCIPVGVIRGVCNYGDEHNNDKWKPYAAAMAAAYAKAILDEIGPRRR